MKNRNKHNNYTLLIFLGFIYLFMFLHLILPDLVFSEQENKNLQKAPELTMSGLVNGSYFKNLETYISDQFPLRSQFITTKALAEYALSKEENNEIYFTANNTLIHKLPTIDRKQINSNIMAISSFVEEINIPLYFSVIPSQGGIYPETLPKYAPYEDELSLLNYIKRSDIGPYFVDTFKILKTHKEEAIYYNSDHHWTSLGAYYGYESFMESFGETAIDLNHYTPTIYSTNFLGTLDSKAALPGIKKDTITTYVKNAPIIYSTQEGSLHGMLYDTEKLYQKNQYELFLGGNHPLVTIQGLGEENILIIGDSYSNSMIPFFIPHYEKIHFVDLRTNKNHMSQYIVEQDIDKVIICYSISNFITDKNLVFLR